MDRYNRAKESDKSLHTLPGLLFSLYMTGRLQPDTTGQQDCKSPHTAHFPPHFLSCSHTLLTDFVLQVPTDGPSLNALCKH